MMQEKILTTKKKRDGGTYADCHTLCGSIIFTYL